MKDGPHMENTVINTASPADVAAVARVAVDDGLLIGFLAKRTPELLGAKPLTLHEDPTEQLVVDTASGEGTGFDPSQEVIVLDVFRDIATVKVRSAPFVEYLHLARFDNRWLIVNALYVWLVEG